MISIITKSGWQIGRPVNTEHDSAWNKLRIVESGANSAWEQGKPSDHRTADHWVDAPHKDSLRRVVHGEGTPTDSANLDFPWNRLRHLDQTEVLGWDQSIKPVDVRVRMIYRPIPPRKDVFNRASFRTTGQFRARLNAEQLVQASLYRPGSVLPFLIGGQPYLPGANPEVFFDFTFRMPTNGTLPADNTVRPRWGDARHVNKTRRVRWGKARPIDGRLTHVIIKYPDYSGPTIIKNPPENPEILGAYMIGNLVTVTELVSGTPLDAANISLALDADSFSWSLSMNVLNRASMNLIRPDSNGPKQVRIEINGHVWVMLVERYKRDKKFPSETYAISGSSRVQLLTAPYASPISGMNAMDISARQVMDAMVLNTGFSIQWNTTNEGDVPDWVISAGALSYNNQTPLQVIARVAESAGAIIRPEKAGDIINVLPRYIAPVWQWSAETSHKILPQAVITSLGGDWAPNPEWNSCYVSGLNQGVSVMVRRAGTQGHLPAPDVFDDLMTDPTIATYRGKVEICKGGDQELVTIQLPLFAKTKLDAPGLVEPGMLCDVREEDANWFGLCLSTQIDCTGTGSSTVVQTLQLERHTSEIV